MLFYYTVCPSFHLLDVYLPRNAVVHAAVVYLHGKISAFVESPEFCVGRIWALRECLFQFSFGARERGQSIVLVISIEFATCLCRSIFLECMSRKGYNSQLIQPVNTADEPWKTAVATVGPISKIFSAGCALLSRLLTFDRYCFCQHGSVRIRNYHSRPLL